MAAVDGGTDERVNFLALGTDTSVTSAGAGLFERFGVDDLLGVDALFGVLERAAVRNNL